MFGRPWSRRSALGCVLVTCGGLLGAFCLVLGRDLWRVWQYPFSLPQFALGPVLDWLAEPVAYHAGPLGALAYVFRIWLAAGLVAFLLFYLGIVCLRPAPLAFDGDRERPMGVWAQLRADSNRITLATGIPGIVLHTAAWCMVIYDSVDICPLNALAFLLGNTLLGASMAYYRRVRLHWAAKCLLGWTAPLGLLVMAVLAHPGFGGRSEQPEDPRSRR